MENEKNDGDVLALVQQWLNDLVQIGMNYTRISLRLKKSPSTVQKIVAENRMPRQATLEALGNYYLKIFGNTQEYGVAVQSYYMANKSRINQTLSKTVHLLNLQHEKECLRGKAQMPREGQIKALVISEESAERQATIEKCLSLGYWVESVNTVQTLLSVADTFYDVILISPTLRAIGFNYLAMNFKDSFHNGKKPLFLLIGEALPDKDLVKTGIVDGILVVGNNK